MLAVGPFGARLRPARMDDLGRPAPADGRRAIPADRSLNPFRYYRRRLRATLDRMQVRGYSVPASVLLHLPRMVIVRVYRRLMQRVNGGGIIAIVNRDRLSRFHAAHGRASGGHFYVIVMPGTLHFLLPSLALLPADLHVMLLGNGARAWERRLIARRFPALPFCSLATLAGTSITHGDVITLLLKGNRESFGLIDHDCYVFERQIFASLTPGPSDCLAAVFGGVSARTGHAYPETYLLFLNAAVLRGLMGRYGVDARIYREVPSALRATLGRIGIGGNVFVKDYANFFDTLHLLLALAIADGHRCRFLQDFDADAIAHVGGTSWKTAQTKELLNCYAEWRFLDLAADEDLQRRYRRRTRPFRSAAHVRSLIPNTPEAFARLAWIDALVERLAAARPTGDAPLRGAEPGARLGLSAP